MCVCVCVCVCCVCVCVCVNTNAHPALQISGIGTVRERMLNALHVTTCGDLYQQRAVLHLLFSQSSSTHFLGVSIGLGSTHVHRYIHTRSLTVSECMSGTLLVPAIYTYTVCVHYREYDRKSMSTER